MCINSPAHGLLALLLLSLTAHADWRGGAARVNITPSYPVRLSGYGNRTTTNEGVKVDIWAKALAIAWNDEPPAVVLTVDNVGVPGSLRAEVLAALKEQHVEDARFAVCSTHTHCAPMLNGVLGNLFGADLSADDQARVDAKKASNPLVQVKRGAVPLVPQLVSATLTLHVPSPCCQPALVLGSQ